MKVNELVNSCQNQWKGLFSHNSFFRIVFMFEDCENIEEWSIDEFNNYHSKGVSNQFIFNRINKRHLQNVISWEMLDLNTIKILVREL